MLCLRTRGATAASRAWLSSTLVDLGILSTESSGDCLQIASSWRAERTSARLLEIPIRSLDGEPAPLR